MSRLDHIKVGDTVRLHGDRFATGYVTGTVVDSKGDIHRVRMADGEAPEILIYEALGGVRAAVWGTVHQLSCVEVVASADPLDGMTPIADMHPITDKGHW